MSDNTIHFNTVGEDEYNLPGFVKRVWLEAAGASGEDGDAEYNHDDPESEAIDTSGGADGGVVEALVPVETIGGLLYIGVGGEGQGGSGGSASADRDGYEWFAWGGDGGARSWVSHPSSDDTVIVGGGGGGGAGGCGSTDASSRNAAADTSDGGIGSESGGDSSDASTPQTGVVEGVAGGSVNSTNGQNAFGVSDTSVAMGAVAAPGGGGDGHNGGARGRRVADVSGDIGAAATGGGGGSNYAVENATDVIHNDGENSGDGYIVVKYDDAPDDPFNVEIESTPEDITLTWENSTGDDVDQNVIYRSTEGDFDSDFSEEPLAEVDPGEGKYIDDDVEEGRTYYYNVHAENETSISIEPNQVWATIPIDPPSGVEVIDVGETTVSLVWTLNSSNEDRVVVEASTDDGEEWTEMAEFDSGVEEGTVEGLLNGREYIFRVGVEVE